MGVFNDTERSMVRASKVFLLGCLLLVGGVAILFLAAWTLAAAGAANVAGEFVAIGLAVLMPCSFLLAGSILPGPPRPQADLLVCPHCGIPSPVWIRQVPANAEDPRTPHNQR